MKKLIFSLIAVTIVLSSCGPAFIASGPRNERGYDRRGYDERGYDNRNPRSADAYILLTQNNPRLRNVTVLVDNRIRVNLNYDNRGRTAKAKQIRVKPGRHNIKVYSNGRFLYERWVVATPNRTIRFSV
ncbi:MAG: hypothetical protein A2X19_01405 [Bacteroidetes bacterium GWE2_39_28]|nr:MAG: hypothetical protein A2X19_01405 [Bacteroidetes bacterium GWE2_39_28]OFY15783.1 MAG: hypothetical protein A2X16_01675 [Bacteroidetes bacterium GWF2_39_10]OFZ06868.1 MAG: hypothetical protein A2322_01465 [Bacteroidetes bacterium RIFOXYB2_FULL_39_7]OFZ09951.1 MAG: hypothetical protein A2465_06615 [Bacteroidetes bacterium RIFOXYC2_FULL_39_11]HCT93493.1 hypothetical protein [Rikenellaceae bacterium]